MKGDGSQADAGGGVTVRGPTYTLQVGPDRSARALLMTSSHNLWELDAEAFRAELTAAIDEVQQFDYASCNAVATKQTRRVLRAAVPPDTLVAPDSQHRCVARELKAYASTVGVEVSFVEVG